MDINKEVDGEQRFFLNDGRALKSVAELNSALKDMSNDTFSYHVNNERNDFSSWIEGTFKDKKLASSTRKCKTKESMMKAFEKPKPLKKKIENVNYIAPLVKDKKSIISKILGSK